jgi:hypothetical protein
MRVTDDRYQRDRSRLELALRLIKLEARTRTIREWTGLSDDRIRKLFRSYIRPGAAVKRHRGKSPEQIGFFLRASGVDADTHALAALLILFGVLPAATGGNRRAAPIARGKLLCEAYEAYERIVPEPRIDFEHAAFLARALTTEDEICLRWCEHCGGINVIERMSLRHLDCRACDAVLPPQRQLKTARSSRKPPATLTAQSRH